MGNLRQYHLAPVAVCELIPVSASNHHGLGGLLLIRPAAEHIRGRLRVVLPCAVPLQEGYVDDTGRRNKSSHLLQIEPIHLAGEAFLTPLEIHHMSWLRWIQEDVRVGPVELGQLCHTDGNLRYAGTALAE